MQFIPQPTDIRYFIGTGTLDGGEEVVAFTTSAAEAAHIANGGKLCGKIALVDAETGHTYARRDKVRALFESGCSMTRERYSPEQVERQNGEYAKAIDTLGL